MFWTDLLSIIRSLNTVYTEVGICHASYVDCLPARSGWYCSSILTLLADSIKTPDDGQQICPKYAEFFIKINLRNSASRWLLL
jgi:hypothetical protein